MVRPEMYASAKPYDKKRKINTGGNAKEANEKKCYIQRQQTITKITEKSKTVGKLCVWPLRENEINKKVNGKNNRTKIYKTSKMVVHGSIVWKTIK